MRIGNLSLASNLLLSPIAGYCDLAFRLMLRPLGGLGLASTDLVNPRGLMRQTRKSMELVETDPDDRPLCIQLYGYEPDEMAAAAGWCEENGAAVVDINMGCPVDKVCKKNGGSALLRNPGAATALAERVVKAVNVPVTAKMRLGWDDDRLVAPELARALEDVGVAAVIVHGRTAAQKFAGTASLDGIARVVDAVRRIPMIGNGDVRRPEDAVRMIRATGCTGVMIGRAALRDPWIFRDTHTLLTTGQVPPPPSREELLRFVNGYFERLIDIRGERRACITIRQRFSWYAGRLGAHPRIRARMRQLADADEYFELMGELAEPLAAEQDRGRTTDDVDDAGIATAHS